MSTKNAGLARKLGHSNVRVYLDGEPKWIEEGYVTDASDQFVETGNIVLIDLREGNAPREGRIPRSVQIPYEELEARSKDIPRNAPIVVYGANDEDVQDAIDDLHDDGYKYVSKVTGNWEGWLKKGNPVESGPIFSNEISWVRKLGPGEVSVAEFRAATEGRYSDVFIIDARTPEEIKERGIFQNTVNIPLDMIAKSFSKIPKDKRIFVHCSTGSRADQAYNELKANGYNARFLLLDITDPACDCKIIQD